MKSWKRSCRDVGMCGVEDGEEIRVDQDCAEEAEKRAMLE
jgi:hypothetical protein